MGKGRLSKTPDDEERGCDGRPGPMWLHTKEGPGSYMVGIPDLSRDRWARSQRNRVQITLNLLDGGYFGSPVSSDVSTHRWVRENLRTLPVTLQVVRTGEEVIEDVTSVFPKPWPLTSKERCQRSCFSVDRSRGSERTGPGRAE